ncbi:hypothetical protein PInf_004947 [Phytophthora infestans]|nr:hypothetical protein PInf_004947 [Phytophthora infestans]
MTIEDRTEQYTTDNTERAQDGPKQTVTNIPDEVVESDRRVSRLVDLDEFDSEHFFDALKRDKLFGPLRADDLNISESDIQLSLDSDPEDDEEGILLDEDNDEQDAGPEAGVSSDDVLPRAYWKTLTTTPPLNLI